MKLNYRRTLFVGFAFFLICAFWQAYDTIIPKILTDKFGMSQANSGIIMALDNVLALFMLPLFGAISDKCRSRLGRPHARRQPEAYLISPLHYSTRPQGKQCFILLNSTRIQQKGEVSALPQDLTPPARPARALPAQPGSCPPREEQRIRCPAGGGRFR